MKRRRFLFWMGLGLFNLSEKLHAAGLDELAAAVMKTAEPAAAIKPSATPTHWTAAENGSWRWYERENLVDGKWKLTGITTPVNKQTGEPIAGRSGYLADSLVPAAVRGDDDEAADSNATGEDAAPVVHQPNPARRMRHGRPPSKWLRSLHADELRIWLKTIDVPEAGVEGMTYWVHLTRDHSFDPTRIAGLTIDEQAKLHAAAHHGY
jgi:hypothetical protein